MSLDSVSLLDKIRMNPIIRTLIKPIVYVKRSIDIKIYSRGIDSHFIRKLKNKGNGHACFIIGNGPSLTVNDLEMIKGYTSFAANRIIDIFPQTSWRPNFYMCVDKIILGELSDKNLLELKSSTVFVYDKNLADKYRDEMSIHYFMLGGKYSCKPEKQVMNKVSEDVSRYFSRTQTVTTRLLELAIYMGFDRIYLLGIDHSFPIEINANGEKKNNDGVKHHFNQYEGTVRKYAYKDAMTESYRVIEKYASQRGIRIVNCTRGGNLEVFERDLLEKVLDTYHEV